MATISTALSAIFVGPGLQLNGSTLQADFTSEVQLSGNLYQTGANLIALINASNAGVSTLNGQSGIVSLVGQGGVTITTGAQTVFISGSAAGVTSTQLEATGQQAWTAGQNNALNLSGSLLSTSGALAAQISASAAGVSSLNGLTGAVSVGGANNVFVTVSGQTVYVSGSGLASAADLAATGSLLYTRDTTISGGLQAQIAGTGGAAVAYTNTISGGLGASIFATGVAGIAYANATFATIPNLVATGSTLYLLVAELSGQSAIDYATKVALASTGQQAWTAAQSNATNLSGNLFTTGANLSAIKVTGSSIIPVANLTGLGGTLVIQSGSFVFISGAAGGGVTQGQLDSLSGWSASAVNLFTTGSTLVQLNLSTSGALVSLISAAAAGVSTINGLSGILNIGAAGGNLFVTLSGQTVFVSGSGIAQASDLVATGAALITRENNISGGLQTQVFATGAAGAAYGNATFSTITNLTTTGGTLVSLINGLSGQSALDYATKAALASTGQQAWTAANANGTNLSGNLALTGQQVWGAAQNNALNLSGNLTQTGVNLGATIANVSGGLDARVFATGAAAVTYGNATFATISNLFTTGANLGTTIANVSGGLQARIFATGAAAVTYGNNTFATLANLTLTGQTDRNNALNLSGSIASTGQQAWLATNGGDLNLSGNMSATGNALYQRDLSISGALQALIVGGGGTAVQVTGSSNLVSVGLSGVGGVNITLAGSHALISGIQPETFILSCSSLITALAAASSVAYFDAPFAFSLYKVGASVLGAPAGSSIQVDVNTGLNNGSANLSILSTKVTIPAGGFTSFSGAQPVITFSGVPSGIRVYVDIDSVGSSNAGTGLNTTLYCYRNA